MATTKETIHATAEKLGLSMSAKFVPWSASRNAGEKQPSLNWKITLSKGGREIITTDYGAGMGHCPSYKQKYRLSEYEFNAIKRECETGKDPRGNPILPELADVLHSLASDADVIDYSTFEEWASNLGYDTDSRKAEATYRACLEIALKLRNALGEDGFRELREAVAEY